MSRFDAGRQIGLAYDLTTLPIADPEAAEVLKEARGIVPEPSQKSLESFIEALRGIATDEAVAGVMALPDNPSPEEVMETMSRLSEEDMDRAADAMTEALIDICSGSPTKEQIEAMPMRLRGAFLGWLAEELVGPTRPTSDSTPSLAGANGAGPATG
jgi:predicted urease superfamily metal-dependent hydrolase